MKMPLTVIVIQFDEYFIGGQSLIMASAVFFQNFEAHKERKANLHNAANEINRIMYDDMVFCYRSVAF